MAAISTTTDSFAFAGQSIAIHDTNWHYLIADQLGTPVVQLKANGTPELVQLKLPYGGGRYAAASLGNLGFTGQRKDTLPNLTYFNARSKYLRRLAGHGGLGPDR
jgi:hypothetical protein